MLVAAVGISGAPPLLAATVMASGGDLSPQVAQGLPLQNAVVLPLSWLLVAIAVALAAVQLRRPVMMEPRLGRVGMVLIMRCSLCVRPGSSGRARLTVRSWNGCAPTAGLRCGW